MPSEAPSKAALKGRPPGAAFGKQAPRAKVPIGAVVAVLVLFTGATLAPLARRAWALLTPRAKPRVGQVSIEDDPLTIDATDLGRAENEGMPASPS
jgi:hypothetical protein